MKLFKKLTVEGQEYQLVSENIALDIERPGRGIFQLVCPEGEENPKGLVVFSLGWNFTNKLTLFFTGEIEQCQRMNKTKI